MYTGFPSCTCGLTTSKTNSDPYGALNDPNPDLYGSSKVGAEERYCPTVYSSSHAEDKVGENRDGLPADQIVTQPEENRLVTSLSNNSIHSNFSDDSLMCGEGGAEQSCSPNNLLTSFNDLHVCDKEDKSRKSYMNKLTGNQVPLDARPAMTAAERDATVIVNKGNPKAWWEVFDEERKKTQREQLAAQRATKLAEKRRLSIGENVTLRNNDRKSSCPEKRISVGSDYDDSDISEKTSETSSLSYPLAFTVDFESKRGNDSTKKLEIGDSIRKFLPKHRRNLSVGKSCVPKDDDIPCENATINDCIAHVAVDEIRNTGNKVTNDWPPETIDVSVQEVFLPSLQNQKQLPRLYKTHSLKSESLSPHDMSIDDSSHDSLCRNNCEKEIHSTGSPVENLIHNAFENIPDECITTERECKVIEKSSTVDVGSLLHEMTNDTEFSDSENVSEAGTYTIEDDITPDVCAAREQEIDLEISSNEKNFKNILNRPSISSSGSNFVLSNRPFVQEWAAQVQQQHMNTLTNGHSKQYSTPCTDSSPKSDSQRPRRKLPVPPIKSSYCLPPVSPKTSKEASKLIGFSKDGKFKSKRADSYPDTECFLKDTESVVSAMQARMDINQNDDRISLSTYYDTNDSGGDSDIDTSVSYSFDTSASVDNSESSKQRRTLLAKLPNKAMLPLVKSRSVGGFDSNPIKTRSHPTSVFSCKNIINNKILCYDDSSLLSDSSSDFSEKAKMKKPHIDVQGNVRNLSRPLWRSKLGYESDTGVTSKPACEKKKMEFTNTKSYKSDTIPPVSRRKPSLPSNLVDSKSKDSLNRGDGGRFSLRANKATIQSNSKSNPSKPKSTKPPLKLNRSNSSLSNKEVEFQNWKRRKEYDPMKAAAEGKKKEKQKQEDASKKDNVSSETNHLTQSFNADKNNRAKTYESSSRSNLARSASFHGPSHVKSLNRPVTLVKEDKLPSQGSHNRTSASSNQQMKLHHDNLKSSHTSNGSASVGVIGRALTGNSCEPPVSNYDIEYVDCNSYLKYLSGEEHNHPYLSSVRNRKKLEALDTLVISTIHSISGKLCHGVHGVLDKLRAITLDDNLVGRMEGLMEQLTDSECANNLQGTAATRINSSSKELSTTLKNLKKIEECINAVNISLCALQGETDS